MAHAPLAEHKNGANEPIPNLGNVPEIIADHRILTQIGQGSYGSVWLGQNVLTGVYRAIKTVFRKAFPDAKPFLREFGAIRQFEPISRSHEGFVQILQVGQFEDAFYYIMELGDDLRPGRTVVDPQDYQPRTLALNRGQALPAHECITIGSGLAKALSVLHQNKLIHRDIKPSNIIFVNGKPKLADIGLVTQIDEARSFVGTAGFMPPEGPTSPQADIYSLGKVLYEISTGKDRCEFPELPDEVPVESVLHLELNQIVLRACHPLPHKRYATAEDLQRELEFLQAGRSIKRLRQLEKRLKWLGVSTVICAIAAVIAFLIHANFKRLKEQENQERERRVGYLLARGTDDLRKGDLTAALPLFVNAAKDDPANLRSHQLRIGTVLARSIQLLRKWQSAPTADLSSDGSTLLSATNETLFVHESATGQLLEQHPLGFDASIVAISHDKERLAAVSDKALVLLHRRITNREAFEFESSILAAVFHPANPTLAISLTNGPVFLFDPNTRNRQIISAPPPVFELQFNSTGQGLATTSWLLGSSAIWDAKTGESTGVHWRQTYPYVVAFSPDDTIALFCGWKAAFPLDALTGQRTGSVLENDDAVVTAVFSKDGKTVATGSYDRTVRLWDTKYFHPLPENHILRHTSRPNKLAFKANDLLITHCMDGSVYVWDVHGHAPKPEPISLEPIPNLLVIQDSSAELVASGLKIVGHVGTNQINLEFSGPGKIGAIALNSQKTKLVVGLKDKQFVQTDALLLTIGTDDPPIRLSHQDGVVYVAFSHDNKKVVTCSEDYSATLWNAETGQRLSQEMKHRGQVFWAAFSSDDQWVVTTAQDQRCNVWDASTGDPLTTPMALPIAANYVRFESGNNAIVAGNTNNTFRLQLSFAEPPFQQYLPLGSTSPATWAPSNPLSESHRP